MKRQLEIFMTIAMAGVTCAQEYLSYVGCYTDEKKEGIHVVKVNTETGAMKPLWTLSGVEGTTYFALNKANTFLYTAQADPSLPKGTNGLIACYRIEGEKLLLVNQVVLGCGSPCYVSLDKEEKAVVWADYGTATAGVCELQSDGSLATNPPVTIQHVGSGPDQPRQKSAHAHAALLTPDNRYLCVTDLGMDQVRFYDFSARKTGLREVEALRVTTAPGAGPRHLTFHPNGKWFFLLNELNNTVSTYAYTGESPQHICTLSTLPKWFESFSKASAIKLTSDGKMLFASNRGYDSIATFTVDEKTGELTLMKLSKLTGKFPRDFELVPGEKFMIVGYENSHGFQVYSVDYTTGKLTPIAKPLAAYKPVCFVFGSSR